MIVTEFYNGQGLGNQLWNYVVTRLIAHNNNYTHGVMSPHKFKGREFLEIEYGSAVAGGAGPEGGPPTVLPNGIENYYREKMTRHPNSLDISRKDEGLLTIGDNSKIDGNLQSSAYIKDFKSLIKKWLKIKEGYNITKYSKDNMCIIHIRGGDFRASTALLGKDYYERAITYMKENNENMEFYIITDDREYSHTLFPDIEIIGGSSLSINDTHKAGHHIGGPIWMDWSILYNCKNAIISASSFNFWPVWLNEVNVIAPMYWADYKKSNGYWSCGDSLIEGWVYLNKDGKFYSDTECINLKEEFENDNKHLWGTN